MLRGKSGLLAFNNLCGLLLSIYAHHVSVSKKNDQNYKPLCDIGEYMSCSKVLTSDYSVGFGIMRYFFPENSSMLQYNSTTGIIHYQLLIFLSFTKNEQALRIIRAVTIVAVISSIYFCVILMILRDFCIVCFLTYVVNGFNFFLFKSKLNTVVETMRDEANKIDDKIKDREGTKLKRQKPLKIKRK